MFYKPVRNMYSTWNIPPFNYRTSVRASTSPIPIQVPGKYPVMHLVLVHCNMIPQTFYIIWLNSFVLNYVHVGLPMWYLDRFICIDMETIVPVIEIVLLFFV